jgi:hypothetical protein
MGYIISLVSITSMPIHTFRVYMKYKKYNYEAKKYDNWNMRGGMCTVTTAL